MQAQQKAPQPQTLTVLVERAFYYKGEVQKVGSKPTLPRVFALEMKAANKVSLISEPAPVAASAAEPAKPAAQSAAGGAAKDVKKGDK